LKAGMKVIQQQMFEAKNNESANLLEEAKRLCKDFGFPFGILKFSLAGGRKLKKTFANPQ